MTTISKRTGEKNNRNSVNISASFAKWNNFLKKGREREKRKKNAFNMTEGFDDIALHCLHATDTSGFGWFFRPG